MTFAPLPHSSFIESRLEKYFKTHLPSWQVIPNCSCPNYVLTCPNIFLRDSYKLVLKLPFPAFRTFNRKGIIIALFWRSEVNRDKKNWLTADQIQTSPFNCSKQAPKISNHQADCRMVSELRKQVNGLGVVAGAFGRARNHGWDDPLTRLP